MDETGFGADKMSNTGQEGDNVMFGFAFDAVNFFNVEIAFSRMTLAAFWDHPQFGRASQAWTSISSDAETAFV